jgi:hypothetical protein
MKMNFVSLMTLVTLMSVFVEVKSEVTCYKGNFTIDPYASQQCSNLGLSLVSCSDGCIAFGPKRTSGMLQVGDVIGLNCGKASDATSKGNEGDTIVYFCNTNKCNCQSSS